MSDHLVSPLDCLLSFFEQCRFHMVPVGERLSLLHKFLRRCACWDEALRAVMDASHHGVPIVPESVDRALHVLGHHCKSIAPAVKLMQYYHAYIAEVKSTPFRDSLNRKAAFSLSVPQIGHQAYPAQVRPYATFYHLCLMRREGWGEALQIMPAEVMANKVPTRAQLSKNTPHDPRWTENLLISLTNLLRVCSKWELSCALFQEAQNGDPSCSSKALSAVLHALAIGRQWHQALSLIKQFSKRNMPIDSVAYDRAVHACYRAEKYEFVTYVAREMLQLGITPHESAVRMSVHASEEAGDWESALYLIDGLRKNSISVTPLMLEEAIRANLCRRYFDMHYSDDAWRKSLPLINELRKFSKVANNPYIYELLIAAWIRSRHITAEKSYDILVSAQRRNIIQRDTRVALGAFLEKCFYTKNWRLFFLAARRLNALHGKRSEIETNLLIAASALVGNWWKAIALWMTWKDLSVISPSVQHLVLKCANKIESQSLSQAINHEIDQGDTLIDKELVKTKELGFTEKMAKHVLQS